MKNALLALAILAAAPAAALADVSKEDVRKLVAAGISDDVIVTFIRTRGPVQPMSADDLVELKQAGASEKVLAALAGGPAPAPRSEAVERGGERKVYVPDTTYAYPAPAYSYYSNYYPSYTYPAYSYSYSPYYYYPRSYSYLQPYCYPSVGFSYSSARHHGRWSWGIRSGWCW